jgi:hypothetical protein
MFGQTLRPRESGRAKSMHDFVPELTSIRGCSELKRITPWLSCKNVPLASPLGALRKQIIGEQSSQISIISRSGSIVLVRSDAKRAFWEVHTPWLCFPVFRHSRGKPTGSALVTHYGDEQGTPNDHQFLHIARFTSPIPRPASQSHPVVF